MSDRCRQPPTPCWHRHRSSISRFFIIDLGDRLGTFLVPQIIKNTWMKMNTKMKCVSTSSAISGTRNRSVDSYPQHNLTISECVDQWRRATTRGVWPSMHRHSVARHHHHNHHRQISSITMKYVRRRPFNPLTDGISRLFTLTDAKLLGFSVEHSGLHPWPTNVPSPDTFDRDCVSSLSSFPPF